MMMLLSTKKEPRQVSVHVPPSTVDRPKILCATDLSPRSDEAVRRTLSLCETLGGQALLLHIVDSEVPMRLAGRRAERAHAALSWLARQYSHLRAQPELSVRIGHPYTTIARAARAWDADLIVIGAHRTASAGGLTWSTAERIAHRAGRPVLVVNTDASRDYSGVMFAARKSLGSFVQLADRFDLFDTAHVSIVPHLSLTDRTLRQLAEWTKSARASYSTRLQQLIRRRSQGAIEQAGLHLLGFEIVSERSTPHSLLARIKKARGSQLLVTAADRRSLIVRALARTTAILALRTRACDVLVAPTSVVRRLHRDGSARSSVELCESLRC
jgi:nucleotide-binding universal stress UspA family protein